LTTEAYVHSVKFYRSFRQQWISLSYAAYAVSRQYGELGIHDLAAISTSHVRHWSILSSSTQHRHGCKSKTYNK